MAATAKGKHLLLKNLWLPLAKDAGDSFFPKLRKNKKMRVFTLTDESNCEEISAMIEASLTTSEAIFGWASSMFKKARLETHREPIHVIGATRFEDCVTGDSTPIEECFPFDILNMDFSSQNGEGYPGRIEKEMISLEVTIRMQKERISDRKGFLLIYTTKLNSQSIHSGSIKTNSDRFIIPNWAGLNTSGLPSTATVHDEKTRVIKAFIDQLPQKYGFRITAESKISKAVTGDEHLLSIAITFKAA
jgi:hypothetical protein